MAFTISHITETVFGNQRLRVFDATADAATQTIESGLKRILWAQMSIKSMAAFIASGNTSQSFPRWAENSNASGVQSMGVIGMCGCVSGDVYRFVTYGPS